MVAFRRIAALCLLLFTSGAFADDTFVFAFPPREGASSAQDTYGPIADFLTRVTGKKFVIHYTDDFLIYQSDMLKGKYDLVFDGPQFIGWRMAKQQHVPLVRLDGNLVFSLGVKKDGRIQEVSDLAGRRLCALAPPNLATLSILAQFTNPARQPFVVRAASFKLAHEYLTKGRCDGVAIQSLLLKKFDQKQEMKAIFTSKPLPNQGFSIGPRIPADVQQKVKDALLSPEGQAATAKLRKEYGDKPLVVATRDEYEGLGVLLKDVWGFEL